MAGSIMQYVLYLAVLVVLAIPLGTYMKKVMYGEKTIFSSIFTPCERIVCKVLHVQESEDMTGSSISHPFFFSLVLDLFSCSCSSFYKARCRAIHRDSPAQAGI